MLRHQVGGDQSHGRRGGGGVDLSLTELFPVTAAVPDLLAVIVTPAVLVRA